MTKNQHVILKESSNAKVTNLPMIRREISNKFTGYIIACLACNTKGNTTVNDHKLSNLNVTNQPMIHKHQLIQKVTNQAIDTGTLGNATV